MILKDKREDDLEIRQLQDNVFLRDLLTLSHDNWNEDNFLHAIYNDFVFCIMKSSTDDSVTVREGVPLAVIIYSHNANILEILYLAVSSDFRGKGMAKALMQHALDYSQRQGAEKVFLEVREDNLSAIMLYKGLGFKNNRIRKNYYSIDGSFYDAWEMLLEL